MAKAPAFQFYAADFLTDTSDWTAEEVGVYIRLLSTQWINGSLPKEMNRLARIAGTTVDAMVEIWLTLGCKFVEKMDGKLLNPKMEEVRHQRDVFIKKQSERGKKSAERRKNGLPLDSGCPLGLNSVATENQPLEVEVEIEEEVKDEKIEDGAEGENPYLVPAMMATWKKHKPTYPAEKEKDFPALLSLSEFICKQANIPYNPRDGECMSLILTEWEKWAVFVPKDDFYSDFSLASIKTNSQTIYQKMRNGTAKRKTNQQGQQPTGVVISGTKDYGRL